MSGRKKIEKVRWLMNFTLMINKLIPGPFLELLWTLTSPSEKIIPLLIRFCYVKKKAKKCGENIYIGKYVTIKNIKELSLGSNISIHAYTYLDAHGEIIINDNVSVANHTTIVSFEHTWEDIELPIKYNKTEAGRVLIEQDVWIGSGCRILSNVTINSRSIVAAGCVVNKSVPSNVIFGGVPGKILKKI